MIAEYKLHSPQPTAQHSGALFVICHWTFVILGFCLRLLPLHRYVTPDEPAWVYRAIQFAGALAARHWAAVPATGHPGVTTMWLGAAGIAIQRLLDPAGSTVHLDWVRRLAWLAPENGEAFRHLAFFLPAGRVAVALVTTLGLGLLYPLLAHLFDRRVALLTVGLLAFDPFLTGHSGLLHTDALLATFSMLALATALNGLREPRRPAWWALAGLFTGLALLTKTPALILLPFILLIWLIANRKSQISKSASPQPAIRNLQSTFSILHPPSSILHSPFSTGLLYVLLTLITVFALYPTLWANPGATFRTLSAFAEQHVETVQRPIFFAGHVTYDPGPAFYPAVFVFRVSPVVLIGLVAGLLTLRRLPADRRLAFLLLVAFAVGFGTLMSLGAKKHDRYLLPIFPPLTLAAALGWENVSRQVAGRQIAGRQGSRHGASFPLSSFTHLLLPLTALILTLPFTPYPLTAFNPLAGGPWGAARVLAVDWGEGMGAAARWLNQLPQAGQLAVAASSIPSFASLFEGHTVSLDQATLADYIVGPPASAASVASAPSGPTLAHTVRLSFLDHAAVYTNAAPLEQAVYLAAHAGPSDLILLDADTPLSRHYAGPGTPVSVAGLPDPAAVTARLDEVSAGRSTTWLVADPAASPITAAHVRQALEAIAIPVHTTTVASATISQYAIRNTEHETRTTETATHHYPATFGEQLTLVAALLPPSPVNAPFPVFLRWQAPAPTPTGLHASLYLRDSANHLWAETGQAVLNSVDFPTSLWPPGAWADQAVKMKLPERIPPGTYALLLTVADANGAQLGAWDASGQFRGVRLSLGHVEIAPPAEPAGAAPCREGRTLSAGPFLACAPDLAPQAVPSGDTLTLALTWSSSAPPQADYSVHWRLLDVTNSVALEQSIALSPHATSRWRAGDSFEARYDLRLDPALPAARYVLALNVLAPDGHPLWGEDNVLATVEILPRDRRFDLPADVAYPLDLTLGTAVHLRGFDVTITSEGVLQPGDALPVTLYWQAGGSADLDYTIFVHLVGPDGRLHGQVDQFPGSGSAPTTSWAPGQVIVDSIVLPVAAGAPAGTYHVAVGMYDAASGGRLPIADSSGHLLPDDQAILPVEITVAGGPQ